MTPYSSDLINNCQPEDVRGMYELESEKSDMYNRIPTEEVRTFSSWFSLFPSFSAPFPPSPSRIVTYCSLEVATVPKHVCESGA